MSERLSAKQVRALFDYEPATGHLTWKKANTRRKVGERAGWTTSRGYRRVSVLGKIYTEHNVIWLLVTGKWPSKTIDHRNRRYDDNSWDNLRPATLTEQQGNRRFDRRNKSGVRGMSLSHNKFVVRVGKDSAYFSFNTREAAVAKVEELAIARFGEFYDRSLWFLEGEAK